MKRLKNNEVLTIFMSILIISSITFYANSKGVGSEIVGFTSEVIGKAYVICGENKILLEGMDELHLKDTIKVLKDSKVSINLCDKGIKYDIEGEAIFGIEKDGIRFKKGKITKKTKIDSKKCMKIAKSVSKNNKNIKKMTVEESKGTLILRGSAEKKKIPDESRGALTLRGTPSPILKLSFVAKELVARRPLFIWSKVDYAYEYCLEIVDETGNKIWETKTQNNYVEYPDNAPALKSEKRYHCRIAVIDKNGKTLLEGFESFNVMSSKEMEEFLKEEKVLKEMLEESKNKAQVYILLGKFYETYNLLTTAFYNYQKAHEIEPANFGLKEKIILIKNEIE